ncbi:Hypothetical predicted protein [Pelobates cultripes]|uniref:Uncharacterized protein n=1 Tax=Pelobates cultripes TaxID=61616 RepID=A0AAD1R1Q9_PELCU|nr:Hypothetical predicted protein [Pelobates cultripes]
MAPSKQTKITDPVRQNKKDKARPAQDGDGHAVHPTSPERHEAPDSDPQTPDEELVTNKSLHTMLQVLKSSLWSDRQYTNELRKEIAELGGRTSHLETKTEEICAAHNELVDKLQSLEEEQKSLKVKLADIEQPAFQGHQLRCHQ